MPETPNVDETSYEERDFIKSQNAQAHRIAEAQERAENARQQEAADRAAEEAQRKKS